ncbi:GIY-YIG nuclease family protein [Nitratiruptor tergarcus]|uniref:Putative endonuclease n=1 Tax=Nitratiruptor tergarcus DSM 16512 TaxID=1069081 RepID=A0A1W1WTF7_9BACT|nr:GIY-YIG nuclease family protein [Nitratiruptor tergarcus]SMC09516.1 putative endonuclease [Nitratiruptor tergarcus DSM 16512]
MKQSYVYIMTSMNHRAIYIGVTSNLVKRVYEHKNGLCDGFTKRYHCTKLVYFEVFDNIDEAINREKYLKGKKRDFKIALIEKQNPKWRDLYDDIL